MQGGVEEFGKGTVMKKVTAMPSMGIILVGCTALGMKRALRTWDGMREQAGKV
jgi:hypothetical protein